MLWKAFPSLDHSDSMNEWLRKDGVWWRPPCWSQRLVMHFTLPHFYINRASDFWLQNSGLLHYELLNIYSLKRALTKQEKIKHTKNGNPNSKTTTKFPDKGYYSFVRFADSQIHPSAGKPRLIHLHGVSWRLSPGWSNYSTATWLVTLWDAWFGGMCGARGHQRDLEQPTPPWTLYLSYFVGAYSCKRRHISLPSPETLLCLLCLTVAILKTPNYKFQARDLINHQLRT